MPNSANGESERAGALGSALLKACRFIEDRRHRIPISSSVYCGAPIARRATCLLLKYGVSRAKARSRTAWTIARAAAVVMVTIYPLALITVHRASEWLLNGLP